MSKTASTHRLYVVTFDTQRDRVYRNWELYIKARNKTEAIAQAECRWGLWYFQNYYRSDEPHMFHKTAQRIDDLPEGRDLRVPYCVDWKPVTWGRR